MIFTDGIFFVFFPIVFLVYWAMGSNTYRKVWLLAASCVFYAAWDWRFLGLVFLVVLNAYGTTLLVANTSLSPLKRRWILIAGLVVSLGVLAFFKYFNFFLVEFAELFGKQATPFNILLPIGISFYTFHSISYMVDTWRGKITPTRNFVDVALYILFFPQLVAGPIVRATDLLPQMRASRKFATVDFKYFLLLFLIGMFKKAVISDNLAPYVDDFFVNSGQYNGVDGIVATFFYTVQIYCDFSGYTDMAIAIAGLLGYQLKPNFAHPYFASNPIQFWRRWHMSLSFWLRDYLYIPLGGNRGGEWMQMRNIFITMLLGGLWHGAAWNFVLWGGLHGVGIIACHQWQRLRRVSKELADHYSLTGNAFLFLWVMFLWIFFRAHSFSNLADVLGRFEVWGAPVQLPLLMSTGVAGALIAAHVLFYRLDLRAATHKINGNLYALGYGVLTACMLPFINIKVVPFIYFQF